MAEPFMMDDVNIFPLTSLRFFVLQLLNSMFSMKLVHVVKGAVTPSCWRSKIAIDMLLKRKPQVMPLITVK